MLKPYHTYLFSRNWNGQLEQAMYDTNIFCYGRANSGKTHNIALPIALDAIQQKRTCILYTDSLREAFSPVLALAEQNNFLLVHPNPRDPGKLCDALLEAPSLLLLDGSQGTEDASLLSQIISELMERDIPDNGIHPVSVVMDNYHEYPILPLPNEKRPPFRYCITTDDQIASKFWRKQLYGKAGLDANMTDAHLPVFFSQMETILCTGVNGIRPKEHKQFAGIAFTGDASARIGGRYTIEERPAEEKYAKAHPMYPHNRIRVSGNEIEKSEYAVIAEKRICNGMWIVECNGSPYLADVNLIPYPLTFTNARMAEEWLDDHFFHDGTVHIRSREDGNEIILYDTYTFLADKIPADPESIPEEERIPIEIAVTKISQKDADYFRVKYLLAVLHFHETATFLKTPEGKALWERQSQSIPLQDALFRVCAVSGFNPTVDEFLSIFEDEKPVTKEQESEEPPLPVYRWDPKKWIPQHQTGSSQPEPTPLPTNGVLFLGGHPNMVKKLKQVFPDWVFVTDDYLKNCKVLNQRVIFYWTGHSSHKMMQFVNARISEDTMFLYVTATNIPLLIRQMEELYADYVKEMNTA